jgi:hypothetical protein
LGELIQELEHTNEEARVSLMKKIESKFPVEIVESAKNFNSELNENVDLTHIHMGGEVFVPLKDLTVKQIQYLLKRILNRVESPNYNEKLGITRFEKLSIIQVRKQITNVQLRNLFYRLINKDFFTRERMFKYKMVTCFLCEGCGISESFKHLMWDCVNVKQSWGNLNTILVRKNLGNDVITDYEDVFNFDKSAATNTIRLKIIQNFIQVERRTLNSEEQIELIITELIKKEKYVAIKNKKVANFQTKWKHFL